RRYEGEWLHDTFHGFGLESFPDGSSYAGEFKEARTPPPKKKISHRKKKLVSFKSV
ncbi:hypothetical protein T484DRAFT_3644868, partial [Baffinella frigidus]